MKFIMTSRLHVTSLVAFTSWSAHDDLYKEGLDLFLSSQATPMVLLGLLYKGCFGPLSSEETLVLMQSPRLFIFLKSRSFLTFNSNGYSIVRSRLGIGVPSLTSLSVIVRAHLIKHLLDLFLLWYESAQTRLQAQGLPLSLE